MPCGRFCAPLREESAKPSSRGTARLWSSSSGSCPGYFGPCSEEWRRAGEVTVRKPKAADRLLVRWLGFSRLFLGLFLRERNAPDVFLVLQAKYAHLIGFCASDVADPHHAKLL